MLILTYVTLVFPPNKIYINDFIMSDNDYQYYFKLIFI